MKALKINWSLFAVAIMALTLTVGCAEEKDGGGTSTKKKPKEDVETFVAVPRSQEQARDMHEQRAEQARRGAIPGQQPGQQQGSTLNPEIEENGSTTSSGPSMAVIEMEKVETVQTPNSGRTETVTAYSGTSISVEQMVTIGGTNYSHSVDTQTATYDNGIEITFGNDGSVDVQVPGNESGTTTTVNTNSNNGNVTTIYPRRGDGFNEIMASYNSRVTGTSTHQGGGYPSTLDVYDGENGSGYLQPGGSVTQLDGETVGPATPDLENRLFNPASFTDWLPEGCDVNLQKEKYCFFRYLPDRKKKMSESIKDGKCREAENVRTGSGIVVGQAWICKKKFSREEARDKANEDWIRNMSREQFREFREAAYYMLEIRTHNDESEFQFDVFDQGVLKDANGWLNRVVGQHQDNAAVNHAKRFFDTDDDDNQQKKPNMFKTWKFMYQCMDYGWRSNDWYLLQDKTRNHTVSKAFDNMFDYFDGDDIDDQYFVEEPDGSVTCKYARCNDLGNGQYHCPDDMPERTLPNYRDVSN